MLSIVLGAMVGVVMGLTGAGGGILAVPLLVFGQHLSVAEAAPVGLLAVGVAAALGALLGLRAGVARYRAALLIAVAGMAMAPVGIWLAQRIDTRILSLLFAAVLLWVAYNSYKGASQKGAIPRGRLRRVPCSRDHGSGRFVWTPQCAISLSIWGIIAGTLSGLLGVGGGFVIVPALQRDTDLETQSVLATSLMVIAMVSLSGTASSLSAGNLHLGMGMPFVVGSLAGMSLGITLSSRLEQKHLKRAFAIVCVGVAVGMAYKSIYTGQGAAGSWVSGVRVQLDLGG